MSDNVTVHIENVPTTSITDALIAIEQYDRRCDPEQHERLTALVLGLRAARDGS